jgi:site-specific DNA recombinase
VSGQILLKTSLTTTMEIKKETNFLISFGRVDGRNVEPDLCGFGKNQRGCQDTQSVIDKIILIKPENDDLPLKRFLKCEYCGRYMRGYKAYKNQKHYYKCNQKGCSNNKRAEELHKVFGRFMADFSIELSDETKELVKRQLIAKYNQCCEEREQTVQNIEKEIAAINQKLERIEERFILEEISKEMHDKYRTKFIEERQEKERELAKTGTRVSNLEEYIDVAFRVIPKLAPEWHSADYCVRQEIQFLLFPEGMYYDKKKDKCRTPRVNDLFRYTAYKQRLSEGNNKGNCDDMSQFPHLVARTGVEPVIPP